MIERDRFPRPPLVLVANDQEWSARSLESILAPNGYAVLRAYTGRQALERARAAHPDLIILDAQMPDLHGVEVCRQLRSDPRFPATVPIIITTAGPSGRAQRLEAYQAGAWEFLGQPLDGESLLCRLQTFLVAKFEADGLLEESLVDPVTGLYNMRGLSRRAREVGADIARRHAPLACVVFSAEPSGAGSGGEVDVTESVGAVLRRHGRASDVIGRVGESEYAVIAPSTPARGAVQLVERIEGLLKATEGGEVKPVRLRAGYSAIPDLSAARLDVLQVLTQATSALRSLMAESGGADAPRMRAFEEVPPASS
ncbi:MAG TPA: response regulator [Gemmatimonadales bacterium]|nr:response regulator [Gemmatimonadales bacterium]